MIPERIICIRINIPVLHSICFTPTFVLLITYFLTYDHINRNRDDLINKMQQFFFHKLLFFFNEDMVKLNSVFNLSWITHLYVVECTDISLCMMLWLYKILRENMALLTCHRQREHPLVLFEQLNVT